MIASPRTGLAAALVLGLAGCASLPPAIPPVDGATVAAERNAPRPEVSPDRDASADTDAGETHRQNAPEPIAPATPAALPRIASGADLFPRLAARLTPPVCIRGEHNRYWRRRFAADPHALARQLRKALPLLAWVVEETERRDLPGEFALIPLVESGYRVDARGRGGPLGLWQMMPRTARHYGLVVREGFDARLLPLESTDAALTHLEGLLRRFGHWRAAAMAYNAGESRLRRALANHPTDTPGLRVSGEQMRPKGLSPITYRYVAKLHALACLMSEPDRAGLSLPEDRFVPLQRHVQLKVGANPARKQTEVAWVSSQASAH